jgi:hypothetical protein
VGCGGTQQIVADSRVQPTDFQRVFPHDDRFTGERGPLESQGLLWQESFVAGLSPLAFFVHAIAGREALVEGATSTAQSGYSMRLGVKAMESTITEYDYSIRDMGRIIQFQYSPRWCPSTEARGPPGRHGTGLDPRMQASVASTGAFADLPVALQTWTRHKINAARHNADVSK